MAKQPLTYDVSVKEVGYYSYEEIKPRYHKQMDDELYKMKNKSYEDALKSIPDYKKEIDPWKDAR